MCKSFLGAAWLALWVAVWPRHGTLLSRTTAGSRGNQDSQRTTPQFLGSALRWTWGAINHLRCCVFYGLG